jgi:tetratricopeptide (TPR) repeat protein
MKAAYSVRTTLSSNTIRLRLHCLLMLALAVCVCAAARNAWPAVTVQPAGGKCLDPANGASGAFNFQQSIQYSKRYLETHQILQAIPCLERARAMEPLGDPDRATVVYDLGLAYLEAGRLQDAKAIVENQLQRQDKAELHNLLGTIETDEHHFRAAARQYQIAAQEDASEQNIFDFAKSLLKFQGDPAEKIFRYGTEKYPHSVRLHVGLGSALYAQGESTKAAEEMCEAARIDPTDPHPMEMIGETEHVPPSLEAEISARLASLVHQYPRNGKLLYYYAMVQSGLWSGRRSASPQTVPLLQRAVTLDPQLTRAHFYLAEIEEQNQQFAQAVENYRKAVELNPSNDQYLYRLAFAYKEAGNGPMFQKEIEKFRSAHAHKKSPE